MFGTVRAGRPPWRSQPIRYPGRARPAGASRSSAARSSRSGIAGLPPSRPAGNDQSRVTISALAPAARAISARSSSVSRSADQCTWKNRLGLTAATSAAGLLANSLSPIAVPASRVPIATATSPSGCTACAPTGEALTGRLTSAPSTAVRSSRGPGSSASLGGANRSSPKAATLSARVSPASAPASSAMNTGRGSRRRARRRASATDSNQSRVEATRRRLAGCGAELVADAVLGDQVPAVGRAELVPEPAHVHVDGSAVGREIALPDPSHQVGTGEHGRRVGRQEREQLELLERERDLRPVDPDPTLVVVEQQPGPL